MSGIAGRLEVSPDGETLAVAAADFLAGEIARGRTPFRLGLSGGDTPRRTYQLLGQRKDIPWDRVEIFFSDERFVSPDNPDSNYRMVRETLLAAGNVAPRGFFAIPTDDNPAGAAARYGEILRQQYGASQLLADLPLFDLMLLGLGPDGHTASLLPGQPVLKERTRLVAAVPDGRPEPRITLTYPALESSRIIMFLVSGTQKAPALRRARAGDGALPAGALQPRGEVVWFTDRAAGKD